MSYIIVLALWALIAFAGWRIFTRAGFKGAMGILFLIPVVNFIALLYLAHKDWPIGNTKN
jgi:hypothetical protein